MSEFEHPSKQEVRRFTKATQSGRKLRTEAARQIWEVRSEHQPHTQTQLNIKQQINSTMEAVAVNHLNATEAQQRLDQLQTEYSLRTASVIKRFLDWLSPKDRNILEANITNQQSKISQFRQETIILGETSAGLGQQLILLDEQRRYLRDARLILDEFYSIHSDKLTQYRELKRKREIESQQSTVEYTINRYGVTFVCGIRVDKRGVNNNQVLRRGLSWDDKLSVLLAFNPDISTSTIQAGSDGRNMWSRMGIIVSGGRVEMAYPKDVGTVTRSINKRGTGILITGSVPEQVYKSVSTRSWGSYNEVVVSSPQIAGFYLLIDDREAIKQAKEDGISDAEIQKKLSGLETPLFLINRGEVYEGTFNEDSQSFEIGSKLTPQDVIQRKIDLTSTKKGELQRRARRLLHPVAFMKA